jgi:hypothetical protein
VVVDDFDVVRISAGPAETEAPLVVDADAVLARPVAHQLLETVGRWNTEVEKTSRSVEHEEFPQSDSLEVRWQPADPLSLEEAFGVDVPEAADHARIVTLGVTSGNWP